MTINLNHLTKEGLIAHATALGLTVTPKMTKSAIIELILDQQAIIDSFFEI